MRPPAGHQMKLLIAIPAYNEEEGIESIISRSLEARSTIIANSAVTEVDITVVSDGSTDRTVELAQKYIDRIKLIIFEKNRGYGTAIKEAWKQSDADLLGFLDADGTCDPNFFAPLCRALEDEGSDIALGNRMHAQSQIPRLRRVGNFIFALMLSFFSSKKVHDTASGMRVVRRASLGKLLPLPDGMHFTPAISARAILDKDLGVSEIDMPYHERVGRSKLKVIKDGILFLRVICQAAFLYRPQRPLKFVGFICLAIATLLMIYPTIYYLLHRKVLEWMIYRFVVSNLLGTSACLLFCAGYFCGKIVDLALFPHSARDPGGWVGALLNAAWFWLVPLSLFFIGGLFVLPSFRELIATGSTYEHWSRFIAMAFLYSIAIILIGSKIIDYFLDMVIKRLKDIEIYNLNLFNE
jgi:glycosyltransferase involved in cell wall biosynthesis